MIRMNDLLHLSQGGYEADVCPARGANLIRLSRPGMGLSAVKTPAAPEDFIRGNPFLLGVPILFPPNRISGAAFTFEGREYRFPLNEPATGCFLHGTLHETPMEVLEHDERHAVCRFRATKERPYLTFPHAFTLSVRFDLSEEGLCQSIAVTNDSPENMPVALGFHTTFRVPFREGGRAEDVRLKLSVGREILRDMTTYLPNGEILEDSDFRSACLDGTLTPCEHTVSRLFEMTAPRRMELTDLATNARVVYLPDAHYRYWMVYNGGSKDFLCVEPQTWISNCPNAPFPPSETGFAFIPPRRTETFVTRMRLDRGNDEAGGRFPEESASRTLP